jgi:hypothetical protein
MATPGPKSDPGDLTTFNILHGFPEALVRGMRNSFLLDSDYHHLTQCETLEDVKLNLTESDYAEALADSSTVNPNILQKAAIEKVRTALQLEQWGKRHGEMIPACVEFSFVTRNLLGKTNSLDLFLRFASV